MPVSISGLGTITGLDQGLNVTGIVTATSFSGDLTGNVTGNLTGTASTATAATTAYELSGTPNLNVGVVTATTYYGSGANLTGIDATQIQTGNTSVQTVDTGSDGHVKITTEGTERWRVTSDGDFQSSNSDYKIKGDWLASRNNINLIEYNSRNVYISDSGNDSTGDGSSSSPWRTLQKAFDNCPRLFVRNAYIIRIQGSSFTHTTGASLNGISGGGHANFYAGDGILIRADSGTVTFNLNNNGIGFETVGAPIRFQDINFLGPNGNSSYNGLFFQDCFVVIMKSSCTWSTGGQGSWSWIGGVRANYCHFVQWNANVTLLSNGTSGLGGLFIYNACTYVNHTCNMLKNGTRWNQAAIVAQNDTFLVHGGNLDNFYTGIRLGTNHYSQASGARCVLGNTSLYNLNIGIDAQYGSHLRSYYVPNIQSVGTVYSISGTSTQN